MSLLDTALAYHRSGLVLLPNDPAKKYPAGLKGWQQHQTTEADVRRWFRNGTHAIGVRDQEGIDIDNKGAPDAETLYVAWAALVEQLASGLVARLLCERTPRGGYHLVWRCEMIAGNQKLATRPPTPDELRTQPKLTAVSLIETRGRGGQFQVAPSPGYTLVRGDWCALPEITPAERQILLDCARALSRADKRTIDTLGRSSGERAGDRYNAESVDEAYTLLEQDGWAVAYEKDGARYLIRPGKDRGVSATFGYVAPGVLYVFTTNAAPFQDGKAYGPFAIYTELEHGGDYKAAARALHQRYDSAPKIRTVLDATTGELLTVSAELARPAHLVTAPDAPVDFYDLIDTPRAPIRWFAPGFIREGLGVVAGEANIGKTPLLVQLALAFASGGLWMNKVQCQQAKVLFIGTEYFRDELGYVIEKSAAGARPPRGMLAFKTLRLDDPDADRDIQPETPADALALLEYFFRVERYEVIIIDVFTGFLPLEPFKQNVYRGDYKEFKPYHVLAMRHHGALIGSWHSVKRESNPRYMYNGSSGLWAVPASRVTMYTDQESRVRLFSMPRFEKKTDWALTQEQTFAGMRWAVSDAAPEPTMGPQELTIYRWIKDNADRGNPKTPATIAEMVSLPGNTVRTLLGRMVDKNLLTRSAGNSYFVNVADVAPVASVANVANVAGERNKAQHERNIEMLRPSTPLESHKTPLIEGAQQAQHHFTDATKNDANELFTADCPPGLTPAQWERANYWHALGYWSDFRRLADETGLGWAKLKELVEERHGSNPA